METSESWRSSCLISAVKIRVIISQHYLDDNKTKSKPIARISTFPLDFRLHWLWGNNIIAPTRVIAWLPQWQKEPWTIWADIPLYIVHCQTNTSLLLFSLDVIPDTGAWCCGQWPLWTVLAHFHERPSIDRPTRGETDWCHIAPCRQTREDLIHITGATAMLPKCPLQWRHNERDGVSNHRRLDCLLNHSDADQRKLQSSASLIFVIGIHRWPVHSSHKWPVTRKMFPFDDVFMLRACFFSHMFTDIKRHHVITYMHQWKPYSHSNSSW